MKYRRPVSRPLEILLVEDNPADVRLIEEALDDAEFHLNLMVAEDGDEAMALLYNQGEFVWFPRPDMILLDLPNKNGREVVIELGQDPELGRIPVVMLTNAQAKADIARSSGHYVISYITMPVRVDQFDERVREALNYWN